MTPVDPGAPDPLVAAFLGPVHPELLRRAWDRRTGRMGPQCVSVTHRWWVRRLSRRHDAAALQRFIEARHVRLDPPDWARVCGCQERR